MRATNTMAPMADDLKQRVAHWAAENPEGAAALRAEGAAQERVRLDAEHEAALAAASAAGAQRERERVAAIRAVVPPGFESLTEQLVADGSSADDAAHAVCAAVREEARATAAVNAAGVVPPVGFVAAPTGQEEARQRLDGVIGSEADDHQLAQAAQHYQAQNPGTSFVQALQAVSKGVN